jgi:hypothetical protein
MDTGTLWLDLKASVMMGDKGSGSKNCPRTGETKPRFKTSACCVPGELRRKGQQCPVSPWRFWLHRCVPLSKLTKGLSVKSKS